MSLSSSSQEENSSAAYACAFMIKSHVNSYLKLKKIVMHFFNRRVHHKIVNHIVQKIHTIPFNFCCLRDKKIARSISFVFLLGFFMLFFFVKRKKILL